MTENESTTPTPDYVAPVKDRKKFLLKMRKRYEACVDFDKDNRRRAMEDLKFAYIPGEQWDQWTKKERGSDRPMYEFNKLRITIKRVVNDMRANRPQGKVRGVEDNDKKTADIYEGLCRNIWNVSDGDTVIDYAAEYQVASGMGAWRICTEYSSDTAFDQDIKIEQIKNPFCLYPDNNCQDPLKRDAMDWFLTSRISKTEYGTRWPKARVVTFDAETEDKDDWNEDEQVRVCEYWYKEPVTKTIVLLNDGKTAELDELPKEQIPNIVRKRIVKSYDIYSCICSGDAILEGPTKWAGCEFPFVIIYGEYVVIDGKTHWYGLTRFGKDAQRSYNYSRTAITESIALAPQAKWWATAEQAKGHTQAWGEAHKKNFPYMLYNADVKAPGAPPRMPGPDVPVALVQETQIASDEIKAVTGIFDASLGNRGNETSGIAIRSRQAQGEIATFNYSDNLAKGIRRTWEILIDLIPRIYDTQRALRIIGADGAEDYVTINDVDQMGNKVNDLTQGKYDVTVTVGPSFSTQRQEAVEAYTQIAQANPGIWGVAGDLIMKAMDLPYAEQISERMQVMLPPPVQQMLNKDKHVPPEVQQMMLQVQQAMQQVQQHAQLVQAAEQELNQMKAENEKDKAGVQTTIANLKTEEAKFNTLKAQFETEVVKAQAELQSLIDQLAMGAQSQETANKVGQDVDQKLAQATDAINSQTQNFLQQAADYLQQVGSQVQQHTAVVAQPRQRQISVKRVNGQLIGEINDGVNPPRQVSMTRTPEGIQGTVQ